VPLSSVGFITGYKGESLRAIERDSGTFLFTDGDKSNPDKVRSDRERARWWRAPPSELGAFVRSGH
jgi:hypothetical protein